MLVCIAGPADAADELQPVRASLELLGPADCADRSLLISGIMRRSQRIHIAAAEPRQVTVRITRAGAELSVQLTFRQPNGRQSSRTLRAPSCEEAFEAAALVTALSLDPSASTAPERDLPPAPTPAAVTPETPPAPSLQPAPRLRERKGTRGDAAGAPVAAQSGLLWSAGVVLAATWQPAPAPMPGIGLSALVRDDRRAWFAPAGRLTLSHFGRSGFSASRGVGEASFQLDTATLELCPLQLRLARLGIGPCGFATGGVLRAAGFEALEVRRVVRPWWVFGGSALAVWGLSDLLQLEAGIHVGKPLIRDRFQFEPLVVHSVRPWVVTVGLGAGFAFR
jgi:hypothetical protein